MENEIKLCFVCSGNTCRSIMAERLLKKKVKDEKINGLKISSKGINALGDNISLEAKQVLSEYGACAKDRKSVLLKKTDDKTLYIAMTESIKSKIQGKVICFKDLIGYDINDPYGQGVESYRLTAKQILIGLDVLINKILNVRS